MLLLTGLRVLVLLGLLFILVAIVGWIAPRAFKAGKTGEMLRKCRLLVGGLVAFIIALITVGMLAPDIDDAVTDPVMAPAAETAALTNKAEEAPVALMPQGDSPKSLGVTPDEFRNAFNDIVVKLDADYKLAEFDIEEGDVDNIIRRSLSRNVTLIGSVSKQDGKLNELMVIVVGGESKRRSIIAILAASQALNPHVEEAKNGKAVAGMVRKALAIINTGESVRRTVGQLQYTVSAGQQTGMKFVISPI